MRFQSTTAFACVVAVWLPQALATSRQRVQPTRSLRLSDARTHTALKQQFPFYHSSAELWQAVQKLQSDCSRTMTIQTVNDTGVEIYKVSLTQKGTTADSADRRNRFFLLAGEHARELIGPESLLYFMQTLCGKTELSKERASSHALDSIDFDMILNGNPLSRLVVESGEYCVRHNPNDVDLNRNWGGEGTGANAGPHAFSEPESRISKKFIEESNPSAFISIHSGTRGMYMPWAFDMEHLATRNQPQMMDVLKTVDKAHCRCPFGAAGKEVGYSCPGTSIDWVYRELAANYSFAYEIWADSTNLVDLRKRWEELSNPAVALLQEDGKQRHLAHEKFQSLFEAHPSDFVLNGTEMRQAMLLQTENAEKNNLRCFDLFNPGTAELYQWAVKNWAAAYLDTFERIGQEL